MLGPSQSVVASAGEFVLSTVIVCSTMSLNATTATSSVESGGVATVVANGNSVDVKVKVNVNVSAGVNVNVNALQTPTNEATGTSTVTGDATTITKTLSLVGSAAEP